MMRFDDRLETLLSVSPRDGEAKSALWGQIADALAQAGELHTPALRARAMQILLDWRYDVTPARRRSVSAALASARAPADIVALFASDSAEIAAPMLLRAALPDDGWTALVPRLSPSSRNLLRQRHDLPFAAQRVLLHYASGDQALPAGDVDGQAEASQPIQIRDLVARIEAYRKGHAPIVAVEPEAHGFRFETAADGAIVWVDGAPRSALIGLSIAGEAALGETGADAALSTAFQRRQACPDGHLFVAAGSAQGFWTVRACAITGADGVFRGMRGIATRSDAGDRDPGLLAGTLAPDSVRQLAHELRTPLNAIRGFSDLIAGQFLGPAPRHYRELATAVSSDARALGEVIGDLDCAARLEMGGLEIGHGRSCDADAVARKVVNELRPMIDTLGVSLRVTAPVGLPEVGMAADHAEALVRRALTWALGLAGPQDAIAIELEPSANVRLSIGRPAAAVGLTPAQLRQSTLSADAAAPHRPPLGVGFSLRLIEALAQAYGGAFEIHEAEFQLAFPPVGQSRAQAA